MSSRQSSGNGSCDAMRFEAAGDRLDRRERVVELVAEHAYQAMPGFALLLPERDIDIAQHDERVRQPALPERAAPHLPLAAAAGKSNVHHSGSAAVETRREADVVGRAPHQLLDGTPEQPLAGAIDQPQLVLIVEREDGDIDLAHHRPQQRRRLERAQPLVAQRVGKGVDLEQRLPERVIAGRASGAK